MDTEIETDEHCICLHCKEHASITIWFTDGVEVDRVSNCCSSRIWEP